MFFSAIVTPDDGAYVVTFPDAPGCVTQADREDQLIPMATDALSGWLAACLDAGDTVPSPRVRRRAPRGSRSLLVPVVPTSTALRVLLHRVRDDEGLTQEALADRLGLSPQTLRKLERGVANPTLATLDRVASALGRTTALGVRG